MQDQMGNWCSAPLLCQGIKSSLNSRIPYPEEDMSLIYTVLQPGRRYPWWFSLLFLRPGFLWHRASIWMATVRVWIIAKNILFFFFPLSLLQPLSGDLLTERQVGVRVQVTGASIVAISVTQLTARRYSTICAAGGVKKNIGLLQAPKTGMTVMLLSNSLHNWCKRKGVQLHSNSLT